MQTLPFYIMFNIVTLLPVLNSLFNPPIYAVRIRYFRVAFIQLLARKTFAQAEQLERNKFGRRLALLLVLNKEKTRLVEEALQLQETVGRGI